MKPLTICLNTCGLIIVLVGSSCSQKMVSDPPSVSEVTTVVQEIMSVGEFSRSPEPNHGVTKLAYIRATEGGNAVWEMDLLNGTTRVLPRKQKARRLFDWSPDDRHLLLRDLDDDDSLTLYNSHDGTFRRAIPEESANGERVAWLYTAGQVAWLTTNSYAYIANAAGAAELVVATLDGNQKILRTVSKPAGRELLAQMSDKKLAFVANGEVWAFDLANSEATQITTNLSKQYLWLRYSKENDAFLYCSEDESEWRHLFRLNVRPDTSAKRTQLTFGPEHTYNGQWIQNGRGFAYVGSLTNHFYLAVRPEDAGGNTNLFSGGYLYGYRVSADGQKIFAVASIHTEPCGSWEYEIATKKLRCLIPGTDAPFIVSKIIPETERWQESLGGLRIPYFRLEPRNFKSQMRYPLVIAVPHANDMFEPHWEKYSQFLANIGVFHLAVNHRGADGYGKTFREDREDADKDILAVRKAALRGGNIDEKRIFLMAHSGGSVLVNKLAAEHPGLWAGIILFGPGMSVPERKPVELPRYFIFMGEKDSADLVQRARSFERWARTNGVKLTAMYDPNTFHFITDVNVDRRVGITLAEFIFGQKFATDYSTRPQTQ